MPKYISSDAGTEFFNKPFKTFLKEKNIGLYHNHSELKAAMIERFNRTLMTRLQKVFDYNNNHKYIQVLPEVIKSYNNTIHRITKYAPAQLDEYNQLEFWLNSYKDLYTKEWSRKTLIKEGDWVRIKKTKHSFEKGYSSSFSQSIYQVAEVVPSKPITYKLKQETWG